MKTTKYFILLVIIFASVQGFSQRSKRSSHGGKKKDKPMVLTYSVGMAYGEASNSYETASFYGPHFIFGMRERIIKLGRSFNFSLDFHLGSQLAFLENDKKLYGYMTDQFTFNFNALAGANPSSKKSPISFPVGFFIGPGVYAALGGFGAADIGPMINLGFRFKLSKTYFFDLRLFGAYTVSETAIGGGTLQFPIKMNKTNGGR